MCLAVLLAGCDPKEDNPVVPDTPDDTPGWLALKLSLKGLTSVTSGTPPAWQLPDKVRVFEDSGVNAILSRSDDGSYTGTTIRESKDAVHTVLIPSGIDASMSGKTLTVEFPAVQQSSTGAIPEEYAIGVGHGSGSSITVAPVFGGLVFSFERDDIIAVTLRGGAGERLSGKVGINAESLDTELLQNTITVRLEARIGYMASGVMILPPVDLRSGFVLDVEAAVGNYTVTYANPVAIRRGEFTPFVVKDEYVPPAPDVINIPDAAFKSYLLGICDADKDGEISPTEAATVTEIRVSTENVYSLEGVRSFPNLETLVANGSRDSDRTILGKLTSLDVSGLAKLSRLECRHNYITAITFGDNVALRNIVCYGNSLEALDLTGAPSIETVDAGDCQIRTVNVSASKSLTTLYLHNNRIPSLDLKNNPRLQSLTCDRNLLTELDLSACPSLTSLDCSPMNDEGGNNLLKTLTLAEGASINLVTYNRNSSNVPDGTNIVYAAGSVTTLATGLRSMYITIPGGASITSKDVWTENCTVRLVDDAGTVYYENSEVMMKGRGNSTWNYDKKPYTLKLPKKTDLIGTGTTKRWVLLANWMDRTLLRNEVAFEMARRTALEWTPSGEFIELFINGRHMGNYWLGEKIKTEKHRFQADYLIEMDTYYDAGWKFYSSYGRRVKQGAYGMPIGVKEPDDEDMTQESLNTLKSLVSRVEKAIYTGSEDYRELLDVTTFIDWYLVHELSYNDEPNHPKSSYFYFRDGKMYAGPVWDFDWWTFQPNTSGLLIPNSIYFGELLKDAEFVRQLKARWVELKPKFATIPEYISAKAAEIRTSEAINWSMWPCTSSYVNGDERMTFDAAVARMISAFNSRMTALDSAMASL